MQKITYKPFKYLSVFLSIGIVGTNMAETAVAQDFSGTGSNNAPGLISKSQRLRQQLDGRHQEPIHAWPIASPTQDTASEASFILNANTALAPETPLIRDASSKASLSAILKRESARSHIQLQLNAHSDTTSYFNPESDNFNLDGSAAGLYLGNWDIWAGAIDRWWGPAWQSPLIMSNNSRPFASINIDRIESTAFQTPLLAWIGPWRINTFLGQLESEREISRPYLWGLRASAMPFEGLEIGFNRVAMFGGAGRNVTPRVLFDVIRGNDNKENQPGNQLGSIDMSYRFGQTFQKYKAGHELYLEFAGEDEAHAFPSKKFATLGYTGFLTSNENLNSWHYLFEYTNTMSGSFGSGQDEIADVTYEHSIYTSGYTYYDQVMGSPIGADTESFLVGLWLDQSSSPSVQAQPRNTGGWLTRKHRPDTDAYHELTLWYERGFQQITYTLSASLSDESLYLEEPSAEGRKYAFSLTLNWHL